MLDSINQEILYLKEKLRKYNKVMSMKEIKSEELKRKEGQRDELKHILEKEKKDYEKLEALSLNSIFFNLLGKKEEKLDKEKQEYLLAKLRYEDLQKSIDELEREIAEINELLIDYKDINNKHEELVREKEKLLIEEGGSLGLRLRDELSRIDGYKIDIKEVREAIEAGKKTSQSLERVKAKLGTARNWGIWDMVGGGFITNVAKHSAISDANAMTEELHYNLNSFKKELSDVDQFTDIQVNLSAFASFADFFLDGIFADWFVQSKINDSIDNVNAALRNTDSIVEELSRNLEKLEEDLKKSQRDVEEILKR